MRPTCTLPEAAPQERRLTLTVDGVATPLAAGIHKGRIVLALGD